MFDLIEAILAVMPLESWLSRRVIFPVFSSILIALLYRLLLSWYPQVVPILIVLFGFILGLTWNYRFLRKQACSRAS